jgi:molecular chaperone DnaJ
MPKDYYKILGVAKSASPEEIKKAYRRLAHQFHPDKGEGGDEQKFKEVNEAYQVLGNTQKRAQYDQFGSFSSGGATPGWDFADFMSGFSGGKEGFEINIDDLFGNFFGRRGETKSERGKDIIIDIPIQLEEAFRGAMKEVELRKFVLCTRCKGSGAEPETKLRRCETCSGTGEVREAQRTFFGVFSQIRTCSTCSGAGEYPEVPCKECGGDGRVRQIEKFSIPIPAGIDDGNIITINGRGEAAPRGGVAGNLIARVSIRKHSHFERQGSELLSKVEITFPEAVLGTKKKILTIDGSDELSVPQGTQSGEQFTLKGRGMPTGRGGRGNHIVEVSVKTPRKISRKGKKLLTELENELSE